MKNDSIKKELEGLKQYANSLEKELEDTSSGIVAMTLESRHSEEKFHILFENNIDGIYQINLYGDFMIANPAMANMLGYESNKELIIKVHNISALHVNEEHFYKLIKGLEDKKVVHNFESQFYHKDRSIIWISENLQTIYDENDNILGYQSIAVNVTQRKLAEERLKLISKVFVNSVEGIIITDATENILEVNKAFTYITGYTADEAIGKTPNIMYSGWQNNVFYNNLRKEVNINGIWQGEIKDRRKNGEFYTSLLTICGIKNKTMIF